jgi:hypothetical protein
MSRQWINRQREASITSQRMSARRTLLRLEGHRLTEPHDSPPPDSSEATITRYEPAGPAPTATGCQTGTLALAGAARSVYPELDIMRGAYGCFNRRRIEGSSQWSLHAEGRALDAGVPQDQVEIGWTFACELTRLHAALDIQRVMWDGHIWSIEEAGNWRRLRPGSNQHTDHVHLEQRWNGARKPLTVLPAWETLLREGRKI